MKMQITAERSAPFLHMLLEVWEASVTATHTFLTQGDIQAIKPLVKEALSEIPVLVHMNGAGGIPLGFMGVAGNKIEMLFISPAYIGQGYGRRFIEHAINMLGAIYVDVNEQNTSAKAFYEHVGFRSVSRSEYDGQGNPFPILHMQIHPKIIFHGEYTIRAAAPEHISLLNGIELAAATIFPPGCIPEHILLDRQPLDVLRSAMEENMLWVALEAHGTPIGYALLQIKDGCALLAQLDVHPNHGRKGIGTALVHRVAEQVREMGLDALYLTTFSHVQWNAPFYKKFGFQVLNSWEYPCFIQNILNEENTHGLHNRVAMKLVP